MRNLFCFFFLMLFSICLTAQKTTSRHLKGSQQTQLELNNFSDSLQYSLGVHFGKWILTNEFNIDRRDLLILGIENAIENKALLINDSIATTLISNFQLSAINKRNIEQEEQLFSSLKGKSGVGALPDGVHYIIVKSATGIRPAYNDTVVINALGMFPDGTLFEDTYQKNQPISSAVSNLIPGLNEAIQLMPVGSVWRIFVPSALAYGSAGLPNLIPPDMALVFEISLLEIRQFKK